MPASEKQIEANRQNAQKSTGPKTESGKRKSAQNALKHGLFSNSPVIEGLNENAEEYKELKIMMHAELRPKGLLQTHLVQKIVDSLWRYRRVINSEKSAYQKPSNPHNEKAFWAMLNDVRYEVLGNSPNSDPEDRAVYNEYVKNRKNKPTVEYPPIPSGDDSLTFGRYESRLDRQLFRSIRILRSLQRLQSPEPSDKRKK
jgi:hypothetical protein